MTDAAQRAKLRERSGVLVFGTYVGAAAALHLQGWLGGAGLRAAAIACRDDFQRLHGSDWRREHADGWRERLEELSRDWSEAERVGKAAGEPALPGLTPAHFPA